MSEESKGGTVATATRRARASRQKPARVMGLILSTLMLVVGITAPAIAADDNVTVTIRPIPGSTEVLSGQNITFEAGWQCGGTLGESCTNGVLEISVPQGQPDGIDFEIINIQAAEIGGVEYYGVVQGTGAQRKIVWQFPHMTGGTAGTVSFGLKTNNWVTPNGTTVTPEATFTTGQGQATHVSDPAVIRSEIGLEVRKKKLSPVEDPYVGSDATYQIDVGYPSQWDATGSKRHYRNMCSQDGLWALHDVVVVDTLPPGVVFVAANLGGVYDPSAHTVTWNLGDSIQIGSNGNASCTGEQRFGEEMLVTVNFPESTFTDAANNHEEQLNSVAVEGYPWLRDEPADKLTDEADTKHYLQIGADGAFTLQKGKSYAGSNSKGWQLMRGASSTWGDWVIGYLHTYSVEGTGNARGTWSLTDMLPCGLTSPTDTSDTGCETPAYTDIAFGANGYMSELKVHWTTNKGTTGVCTIPEGHTAGDTTVRLCEGLASEQPIAMASGEWITKFELIDNPVKAGTKGKLFLFGTVSSDIPLDNSQEVADGVYQPHYLTTGSQPTTTGTPVRGVTPASEHPLWVTVENCTADNTITWAGGTATRNGSLVDSNHEGRCGYTRISRDVIDVYAEKRVYNPDTTPDNQKGEQANLRPGESVRVEVVTQRERAQHMDFDPTKRFTPTVTDILPDNLRYDPRDPSQPVYLAYSGEGPETAAAIIAKLGEPRLTLSEVELGGVTRTQIVIDFPDAPEGGGLSMNEEITIGFDARVVDNAPTTTKRNYLLVQAAEAANEYLVCSAPGQYADPKISDAERSWGDLSFDNAVQGPEADTGCRTSKPYTIIEGPGMNAHKQVKGVRDSDFVASPGLGSTNGEGTVEYRIPVTNTGNVDMRNVIVYDMLPRVNDHGVRPNAGERGSEFDVFMAGPVTGLPADAVVQYSTAEQPCRGELAGNGGGNQTSAPAGCVSDWSTSAPSNWSDVTAIRIDFGARVWRPGETHAAVFPAVAGENGDLTGTAWNNVAIAGYRNSDGTPILPTEAPRVGFQLNPDVSWRKVDGLDPAKHLSGTEWTLTPVVAEGEEMPAGEWPITITDCVLGGSCDTDQDPVEGRFTLRGIPWGTYDLEETKAPSGYVIAKDPIRITIGAGNLNTRDWVYEIGNIVNFMPGLDVTWEKVDPEQERLAGSEWKLVPINESGAPVEGAAPIVVSDCIGADPGDCVGPDTDPAPGKFHLVNVPEGQYHLIETKAPAGFTMLDEPITVTVEGDTAVNVGQIENKQITVPTLPLTGGIGTMLFILGGAALMLLTAYSAARSQRARRAIETN